MGERRRHLEHWLAQCLKEITEAPDFQLTPASADASFRRYFRVTVNAGSYIVMDAPPEHEDCRPFVAISGAMADAGLNVPKVLSMDLAQGFLLLTDLGDRQYLGVLDQYTVQQLYADAMQALLLLQKKTPPANLLPKYSHELLTNEMNLFRDWFINDYLNLSLTLEQQRMLNEIFELLAQQALVQPQVWVHRDYHSRNLMWLECRDVNNASNTLAQVNPGILDFQDAVIGPVSYDLVSLLRDCYISWPRQQVVAWVKSYQDDLVSCGLIAETVSNDEFQRWFDWMGMQRHLKAIGIFARLNIRDGKSGYLADIPRTLLYVLQVCRDYHELSPLYDWLQHLVVPRIIEKLVVDSDYFSAD
jgi:hypothetical protein